MKVKNETTQQNEEQNGTKDEEMKPGQPKEDIALKPVALIKDKHTIKVLEQLGKDPQEVESMGKTFQDTISSLPSVLPQKSMGDVSVSFCFICLLHLANEKNLTLVPAGDLSRFSLEFFTKFTFPLRFCYHSQGSQDRLH